MQIDGRRSPGYYRTAREPGGGWEVVVGGAPSEILVRHWSVRFVTRVVPFSSLFVAPLKTFFSLKNKTTSEREQGRWKKPKKKKKKKKKKREREVEGKGNDTAEPQGTRPCGGRSETVSA